MLAQRLDGLAAERGDAAAFTWVHADGREDHWSFGQLRDRAAAVADALADVGTGSPAVLYFAPGLDHVAGLVGCLAAGVPAVSGHGPPLGGAAKVRDAAVALLERTAAQVVLTDAATRDRADEPGWIAVDALGAAEGPLHRVEHDPAADAIVQFTSGSTGTAKAVVLSAGAVVAMLDALERHVAIDERDVVVSWVPLYHDLGLVLSLLVPMYGSREVLLSPLTFLHRPVRWLQAATRHRATILASPNFGFELCVRRLTYEERDGLDLSSVQIAAWGAEPARPATIEAVLGALGPVGLRADAVVNGYGMSEFGSHIASQHRGEGVRISTFDGAALEAGRVVPAQEGHRLAAAGRQDAVAELAIVDPETRTRLAPELVGEIWVRGPAQASAYLGDEAATAESLQARLHDGSGPWVRTGDLGFLHGDEVYLWGRSKDVIVVRGRNLLPQDIEDAAAAAHDSFAPNSTIAFGHEDGTRESLVVVQEVEVRDDVDLPTLPAAIAKAVADRLGVRPDRVVLVGRGRLPRGGAGKLRRSACRSALMAGDLPAIDDQRLTA